MIKGQVVTLENAESFDADDWPVRFFEPSAGQAASSLALVGLGLAGTLLIGRLGNSNGGDD